MYASNLTPRCRARPRPPSAITSSWFHSKTGAKQRRENAHPAPARRHAPFVAHARAASERVEMPAAAAVQFALRDPLEERRWRECRRSHVERQPIAQPVRPRVAPHGADAVGVARLDRNDGLHIAPPPRPFLRCNERCPDPIDRRVEQPLRRQRISAMHRWCAVPLVPKMKERREPASELAGQHTCHFGFDAASWATRSSHHGSSASAIDDGNRVPDCRTAQRNRLNGGRASSSSAMIGVSRRNSSRSFR